MSLPKFSLLLASFFLGLEVSAQNLQGAALLNKISHSLKGVAASVEDQKKIAQLPTENEKKIFIEGKVNEYLKSVEYTNKMTFRLQELFEFLPSGFASYDLVKKPNVQTATATNYLFDSMTQENRKWDDLLLSKKYLLDERSSDPDFTNIVTDYGFYGSAATLPSTPNGYLSDIENIADSSEFTRRLLEFPVDDLRIAGVVTSPRFFERYGTTGINKNRRRAAALFKIFLCDSMTASIPTVSAIDQSLYNMLYPLVPGSPAPRTDGMSESEVRAILNKNDQIHGTRADCMSCHYKLDPAGQVFRFSSALLSSKPAPGALVYKNSQGQKVNVPVNGIGELAKALTLQPDYVSCQIKSLWNWYVGEDKKITPTKLTELQQAFEKVGRRTNDFVKYLVFQNEFAERELPNEIRDLARNTKKYMQRCQSCHKESTDYVGTDLTIWPLGSLDGNQYDAKYWLKKLESVLDLNHLGLKRTMPPAAKDGGFIPSRQELEMLKAWIDKGGPDENGKQQVIQ